MACHRYMTVYIRACSRYLTVYIAAGIGTSRSI